MASPTPPMRKLTVTETNGFGDVTGQSWACCHHCDGHELGYGHPEPCSVSGCQTEAD